MDLSKYRVPDSALEGVDIELPESGGAVFRVKLPTNANREWHRETLRLLAGSGLKPTEDGKLDMRGVSPETVIDWQDKRRLAFARICVVSGPPGFDLNSLRDAYYPALLKLLAIAEELAEKESQEASDTLGEA